MKKGMSLVLALTLVLSLSIAYAENTVGVLMPTKEMRRWNRDGEDIKARLTQAGYAVDLQFAGEDAAAQLAQMEKMLESGVRALVIAPVDGGALSDALAKAKEKGVKIIAYDRLLTGTENVDAYATFDGYRVGATQAQYVVDALSLDSAQGPFTIEWIAGSPLDSNAKLFFDAAMDTLKPYIDAGKLVTLSGQTAFEDVATPAWSGDAAKTRMDGILSAHYKDAKLDVCLCANDSMALGVIDSLVAFGCAKEDFPLVTGQDCDIANVQRMMNGLQAMSVFKDTRILAEQAAQMTLALLAGEAPETNATYHNGVIDVPAYNCDIACVDAANAQTLLIDGGYYTAEELQ